MDTYNYRSSLRLPGKRAGVSSKFWLRQSVCQVLAHSGRMSSFFARRLQQGGVSFKNYEKNKSLITHPEVLWAFP